MSRAILTEKLNEPLIDNDENEKYGVDLLTKGRVANAGEARAKARIRVLNMVPHIWY